jgi:hypothetical protein
MIPSSATDLETCCELANLDKPTIKDAIANFGEIAISGTFSRDASKTSVISEAQPG